MVNTPLLSSENFTVYFSVCESNLSRQRIIRYILVKAINIMKVGDIARIEGLVCLTDLNDTIVELRSSRSDVERYAVRYKGRRRVCWRDSIISIKRRWRIAKLVRPRL